MKNLAIIPCVLVMCHAAGAIDLDSLVPIGPVVSYLPARDGITLACADQSQVRLQVLAPDLVRVRASFGRPLPERDHSWAIEKTAWDLPKWSVRETPDSLLLATTELEVVVHRSPLLIEFRDASTHRHHQCRPLPHALRPAHRGCGRNQETRV